MVSLEDVVRSVHSNWKSDAIELRRINQRVRQHFFSVFKFHSRFVYKRNEPLVFTEEDVGVARDGVRLYFMELQRLQRRKT